LTEGGKSERMLISVGPSICEGGYDPSVRKFRETETLFDETNCEEVKEFESGAWLDPGA
jgi:hypothetical protein